MNLPSKKASLPGTLFLTYQAPSSAGSGPQIRAAGLLRMLGARGEVRVMVVNRYWQLPGPSEPRQDCGYSAITYLRILPDSSTAGRRIRVASEVPYLDLPTLDCAQTEMAHVISDYARKYGLEQLFVFRMETLSFTQGCLKFFPNRLLDLDELPSRRDRLITGLKGGTPSPAEKRAQLASLVLEKKLIPLFRHVFVASEMEAAEVRLATAFQHPFVLPNIAPRRLSLSPSPRTSPQEILFVGMLSYFPNLDSVLWFCREILPRIRQSTAIPILFRVIGFGQTPALDPIRNLPGVHLSGYQADLVPFYTRAAFTVVPLRAGGGTRLKILEAFAYGRAVVSTTIGAEGLKVTHGRNILLADTSGAFAEACLSLIEQPELAHRIAGAGRCLREEHYSEEALLRRYDEALGA